MILPAILRLIFGLSRIDPGVAAKYMPMLPLCWSAGKQLKDSHFATIGVNS